MLKVLFCRAALMMLAVIIATLHAASAESCSDVLINGVQNEFRSKTSSSVVAELKKFFSKSYEEVMQESSHGGGSFEFFEMFELGGGGGSEKFKSLKQQFTSNESAFLSSQSFADYSAKVTNDSVINAWKECMAGRPVIHYLSGDPTGEFTITVRYRRQSKEAATKLKVLSLYTSKNLNTPHPFLGFLFPSGLQKGAKIEEFDFVTQPFERTDKFSPAYVKISIAGAADVEYNLPAEKRIPPIPPFETFSEVIFNGGERKEFKQPWAAGDKGNYSGSTIVSKGSAQVIVEKKDTGVDVVLVGFLSVREDGGDRTEFSGPIREVLRSYPAKYEVTIDGATPSGAYEIAETGPGAVRQWDRIAHKTNTPGISFSNLIDTWEVVPHAGEFALIFNKLTVTGKKPRS